MDNKTELSLKIIFDEISTLLKSNNQVMEYAAFNYDGSKLSNLKPGLIDSTGVSDSLLIQVRENNEMLNTIRNLI